MPTFLSQIEEVLRVDGRMSTSIWRPKNLPFFPTVAKSLKEELFLYLAFSPAAVSAALIKEKDRVQKPIYYTS